MTMTNDYFERCDPAYMLATDSPNYESLWYALYDYVLENLHLQVAAKMEEMEPELNENYLDGLRAKQAVEEAVALGELSPELAEEILKKV